MGNNHILLSDGLSIPNQLIENIVQSMFQSIIEQLPAEYKRKDVICTILELANYKIYQKYI